MFRIQGDRNNLWRLEAYDGDKSIVFFNTHEEDSVIIYSKTIDGLIRKRGHKLNRGFLQSLFNDV